MIKIGEYNFFGPYLLLDFEGIDRAAIYAILCKNEISGKYQVIYIGQSGEFGKRLDRHEKRKCWEENCRIKNLYVAVFYTPTDQYSKEERLRIENELINFYEPVCNEKSK
jgi:hypothetical protein